MQTFVGALISMKFSSRADQTIFAAHELQPQNKVDISTLGHIMLMEHLHVLSGIIKFIAMMAAENGKAQFMKA